MVFPRLLALIDDELERLRKARALLASLLPGDELDLKAKVPELAEGETATGGVAFREETKAQAPVAQTPPAARPIYPAPRRAPRERTKAQAPAPERALGRPAPAGPVFVAAAASGQRPSAPDSKTAKAGGSGGSSSSEGLTAEMLARRWLQPPTMS